MKKISFGRLSVRTSLPSATLSSDTTALTTTTTRGTSRFLLKMVFLLDLERCGEGQLVLLLKREMVYAVVRFSLWDLGFLSIVDESTKKAPSVGRRRCIG